jgi:hypothetical protein
VLEAGATLLDERLATDPALGQAVDAAEVHVTGAGTQIAPVAESVAATPAAALVTDALRAATDELDPVEPVVSGALTPPLKRIRGHVDAIEPIIEAAEPLTALVLDAVDPATPPALDDLLGPAPPHEDRPEPERAPSPRIPQFVEPASAEVEAWAPGDLGASPVSGPAVTATTDVTAGPVTASPPSLLEPPLTVGTAAAAERTTPSRSTARHLTFSSAAPSLESAATTTLAVMTAASLMLVAVTAFVRRTGLVLPLTVPPG